MSYFRAHFIQRAVECLIDVLVNETDALAVDYSHPYDGTDETHGKLKQRPGLDHDPYSPEALKDLAVAELEQMGVAERARGKCLSGGCQVVVLLLQAAARGRAFLVPHGAGRRCYPCAPCQLGSDLKTES